MAARHYAQFLDASDPDQAADDDWRIAQAPPEILRGSFRLGFIARDDSSYGGERYLLSVVTADDHLAFLIEPDGGGAAVSVYVDGALFASHGPITFEAGQELTLVFGAVAGTVSVAGATTGDGETDGIAWNVVGGALRLGGNVVGGDLARGYVSLPYAVLGAPIGDEPGGGGGLGQFDFSNPDNSGLITLL